MSKDEASVAAYAIFEKINVRDIDSLGLKVAYYKHSATGAMHIHLASDNTENVFMVAFRTMPMDDTGVAHILEHTALCGSKRYPVRDPFFMMIRRSLNTFMNAFTSSDWTAYPFASKNKKDFRYGTITHSGHASQRVLLSLIQLKGWSPFARRY